MTDPNSAIPILEPLVTIANTIMSYIKVLVGGVFGLYVIMAVMRWWNSRQIYSIAKDVQNQLQEINQTLKKMKK